MKFLDNLPVGIYKYPNGVDMQKITKGRLSAQVYEIIRDMIIAHRFRPGTRINVEQITKEVGVSRTPVWEAIHRLMQDGLLESIPNRGVFMATLTPQRALELYTVREALECLAGRLAVGNVTDRVIKKLEKMLGEQQRAIQKEDLVSYSKLDFDFHSLIYEQSGNPTLVEMLGSIKGKMGPIALHITPILSRFYDDHVEIVAALKARDEKRAEETFRHHNRMMIEQIKQSMDEDTWKGVLPDESAGGRAVKKKSVVKGLSAPVH